MCGKRPWAADDLPPVVFLKPGDLIVRFTVIIRFLIGGYPVVKFVIISSKIGRASCRERV